MKITEWLKIFLISLVLQFSCSAPTLDLKQVGLLIDAGEFEKATSLLSEYLEENPTSARALRLRADCYYQTGKRELMINDLRILTTSEEATCEELFDAGNDLVNEFDLHLLNDSALKYQRFCLSKQLSCNLKGVGFGFIIVSTLLERMGEHQKALAAVDSAEIFNECQLRIAESRAGIFENMGELDSAIHWQTIAIDSQDDFPGHIFDPGWVYLDRANLYQKINNLPAACADWQKAFELGTDEAKLKLDSFCTKTK